MVDKTKLMTTLENASSNHQTKAERKQPIAHENSLKRATRSIPCIFRTGTDQFVLRGVAIVVI